MAAGLAFHAGRTILGYTLGGALSAVGLLVSTTDICLHSMFYRLLTGFFTQETLRSNQS